MNQLIDVSEQDIEAKLNRKKDLIIRVYKMIVKGRVEGLLSLEGEVEDYESEPDFVIRTLKRTVNLIIYLTDEEQVRKVLEFEKALLLNSNTLTPEEIEFLFLIEYIFPSILNRDPEDLFKRSRFATVNLTYPRGNLSLLYEIELEMEKEKLKLVQGNSDYPITLREGYKECKDEVDKRMSFVKERDDRHIQIWLREIYSDELVLVLGMCDSDVKDKILVNLSQRAGEMMAHDVELTFYEMKDNPVSLEAIRLALNSIATTFEGLTFGPHNYC